MKLGLSLVKSRTFNSVNPQFPQSKTLVLQLIEYQTDMFFTDSIRIDANFIYKQFLIVSPLVASL